MLLEFKSKQHDLDIPHKVKLKTALLALSQVMKHDFLLIYDPLSLHVDGITDLQTLFPKFCISYVMLQYRIDIHFALFQ